MQLIDKSLMAGRGTAYDEQLLPVGSHQERTSRLGQVPEAKIEGVDVHERCSVGPPPEMITSTTVRQSLSPTLPIPLKLPEFP